MSKSQNDIKNQIMSRTTLLYLSFLILGFLIIARIAYLQFINDEKWLDKYNNISVPPKTTIPVRADILDVHGKVLATTLPLYKIRFDTQVIKNDSVYNANIDSLSICLSNLLKDKTSEEYVVYLTEAREKGDRYLKIADDIAREDYLKLKKFPIFIKGRYRGGMIADNVGKRINPFGALLKRTIGHLRCDTTTDKDIGAAGLELTYDKTLKGTEGYTLTKRLVGKKFMPIHDDDNSDEIPGKDIITSIDINIQDFAHQALKKQMQKSKASYGTLILMEVETGFIKAIVNLGMAEDSSYIEDFNYAVGTSLAPGSTFKLPSLVVALEKGDIKITDTVDTGKGRLSFGDYNIKDEMAYGKISVEDVFRHSSNVGMATIIRKSFLGKEDEFIERLTAMKLNEISGIDIDGEVAPTIRSPKSKEWSGVTLAQMAVGYEVKYAPIQILTFYNAIANNGLLVKPRIVKAFREQGKEMTEFKNDNKKGYVCNSSTLKQVQEVLEAVVQNGTARSIYSKNYRIAGKTGTAKIYNENLKKFNGYRASFVGYFPADKPKYSCMVMISEPEGNYYGSQVAAPVFKKIADKLYSIDGGIRKETSSVDKRIYLPVSKNGFFNETEKVFETLNIKTDSVNNIKTKWIFTTTGENSVKFSENKIRENKVPKVLGMGAKDAVYLLEKLGMKVSLKGRGEVKKQSVKAGKMFLKGDRILIELG